MNPFLIAAIALSVALAALRLFARERRFRLLRVAVLIAVAGCAPGALWGWKGFAFAVLVTAGAAGEAW